MRKLYVLILLCAVQTSDLFPMKRSKPRPAPIEIPTNPHDLENLDEQALLKLLEKQDDIREELLDQLMFGGKKEDAKTRKAYNDTRAYMLQIRKILSRKYGKQA